MARTAAPAGKQREGTKQALLIGLLRRPDGVTLAEAVVATGWQAHTVRGAFAGALKKRLGLTIAHERGCEADLAALIDASLDAGAIPALAEIRARFQPGPEALPQVTVTMAPLSDYDVLTAAGPVEGAPA